MNLDCRKLHFRCLPPWEVAAAAPASEAKVQGTRCCGAEDSKAFRIAAALTLPEAVPRSDGFHQYAGTVGFPALWCEISRKHRQQDQRGNKFFLDSS